MENNQEHKIDKIFRETFENQEITPPSDAWMGIHTYTIGQEEKKPKVWLKYASLAMLLFLISGFGFWYFVDNHERTSMLLTQKVVNEDTDHGGKSSVETQTTALDNAGRQFHRGLNSDSVKILNQFARVSENNLNKKTDEQTQELNFQDVAIQIPIIENKALIVEDSLMNDNIEFTEPISYFKKNKMEFIESKSLVLNDLPKRMNEDLVGKIDEDYYLKVESVKTDSVAQEVEGKKRFSLKHPIINFRLGLYNNSVKISANQGGKIPFANDIINSNNIYAFLPSFDIAWKLNKKSRISLNLKYINYYTGYTQSKSGAAYIDPLSPTNKPTGTFEYNSLKDVYEYLTPFGYVTQPVDPKFSFTPKDFDVRLYGRFSAWQIGTNYEHDLITFRNKKGGIPAMEIYGSIGLNIQKMRKYSYSYSLFKNYDPKDNTIDYVPINTPIYTQTELSNGSPIIFGYNAGLGIRFQLSKRFGLNISGNYETNINSWVKDLPFKTRLSLLTVESGFFVNL